MKLRPPRLPAGIPQLSDEELYQLAETLGSQKLSWIQGYY